MAGIYIHIPFCKQACHYCNFHFSTSMKLKNDFSGALLKEITLRRDYLEREKVNTI
jgi:oxygen-independent coproporphyrinogen-3 oxidase